MKGWLKFLLALVGFVFLAAAPLSAQVIRSSEQNVTVARDEVIEDDLFLAGEDVTMAGLIKGNLFAAGETVEVTGQVEGAVFVVGGTVRLEGARIGESIMAGAGQMVIRSAQVGGSLILGGGAVEIDSETRIGGMLLAGAGQLQTEAQVGRGVLAGAGTASLGGRVGHNLRVTAGTVTLMSGLQVGRDFIYTADQEVVMPQEAQIAGRVQRIFPSAKTQPDLANLPVWQQLWQGLGLGQQVWSFLAALLVGAVLLRLFPKSGLGVADLILQKPWQSLWTGLLALALALPLFVLLLMSVVGIPLAILGLTLFVIHLYLTRIFIAVLFGRSLLELTNRSFAHPLLTLAVGLLVWQVLASLPVAGFLISSGSLIFGLGAVLSYERQQLAAA